VRGTAPVAWVGTRLGSSCWEVVVLLVSC